MVARYQQYRAVRRALDGCAPARPALQDGERDRRGGIIWHTQGSGKCLTMVFLVRAMRSDPLLRAVQGRRRHRPHRPGEAAVRRPRADRRDVRARPTRRRRLKELLAEQGPALVFAMIQKYRDTDASAQRDAPARATK